MSSDDATVADEIRRLEEQTARNPRAHTFARLADLYRKDGRLERALEVVEAGLVHHPRYLNARIVHARVLRELGRPDEAASAFRCVLEIDAENLVAKQALRELRSEGAIEAIRTLREAARPADGERPPRAERPAPETAASRWLARLEADWREERDAPGAAAAGEGRAAAAAGPGDATAEAAEAAEPEEREKGVATATLAALYVRQGLYEEAIGMYEKLLARDPYNARLAQALQETRRLGREGGAPVGRAGKESTRAIPRPEAPAAPARSDAGPDRPSGPPASPAAARASAGEEALTIRAYLTDLLEGRAPAPDTLTDASLARLRRWLGAEREREG